MGLEIERKFLVNHAKWGEADKPQREFYRQGYLLTDPNKTIRVRATDTKGFMTIKGKSEGATRTEFEYEIPKDEAIELLDLFAVSDLTKYRYKVVFAEKLWEVDVFLGENEGLIVAEIELQNEDEMFELPEWVEEEVTGEKKYYNSNLSTLPFRSW
ncbi:adenylate cyclase [Emticicia oligotrophica DSM 17448]|uniref:Adenylate cyclase n=1 Tax=Emticicia oligotrophica (strain DSM 17448 / CIP 109782 / MTCC 6937 / GPTSA100-15) TaxID=929562 RepID=A0ABN4AJT1_EMTOG|nr:CYTH domain-containing protein [Emticicia oligotrophica]AFK02291.1 adenylate cyclase [Emticicia oligotrophica DSM 17448]